jgi:hypothetical protein
LLIEVKAELFCIECNRTADFLDLVSDTPKAEEEVLLILRGRAGWSY